MIQNMAGLRADSLLLFLLDDFGDANKRYCAGVYDGLFSINSTYPFSPSFDLSVASVLVNQAS